MIWIRSDPPNTAEHARCCAHERQPHQGGAVAGAVAAVRGHGEDRRGDPRLRRHRVDERLQGHGLLREPVSVGTQACVALLQLRTWKGHRSHEISLTEH